MLRRLFNVFRGQAVTIPGTDKLEEGVARTVDIGDPAAGGTQVLLCRVEGKIYALDSACPHEGGRLIRGPLVDGKYAVCPLHNYRFDPKDGGAVGVTCKAARTFAVGDKGDSVQVRV